MYAKKGEKGGLREQVDTDDGTTRAAECNVYLSCIYRISIVYLTCMYRNYKRIYSGFIDKRKEERGKEERGGYKETKKEEPRGFFF